MATFFESTLGTLKPCSLPWKTANIAMDIGSTQTRTRTYNSDAILGEPILLDSNYESISRDISHVMSPSSSVIANLDMIITDLTADNKVKPMITTEHVVKGDMLSALTVNTQITVAAVSKIDQKATYVNAIVNIALVLLQDYVSKGQPAEPVTVNLTISLPPEDTKHRARLNTFRETLAGRYTVEFTRLNVTVEFVIPEDIDIISEPEAVAVYQSVMNSDDNDDGDSVICVIDIGGRSAGITFIADGHLLVDSCVTVNLGGSRLAALFSREIASSYNIQEPLVTRAIRSLSTGTFMLGAQRLDVSEQLNRAKEEFASLIFNEFMRAVDINGIQLQNISRVYCSGGTFGEAPKSASIIESISRQFSEKSAYTEFELIKEPLPILCGLCYRGIMHGSD